MPGPSPQARGVRSLRKELKPVLLFFVTLGELFTFSVPWLPSFIKQEAEIPMNVQGL